VKGDVSAAGVYDALQPLAYDLGIRLEPAGNDYKAVRLPPAKPLELGVKGRKAQEDFFESPRVPEKLEKLIEKYADKKTGKAWNDPAVVEKLRKAIVEQKADYWKEGRKRRITYETGYSVLGYLAYQFPVYFIQSEHIIYELAMDGLLKDRMKVLDAGTGRHCSACPHRLLWQNRPRGSGRLFSREIRRERRSVQLPGDGLCGRHGSPGRKAPQGRFTGP